MSTIRPHGGYRELRSFQTATIIYDATYWFCERFLDPRSRTCDQMVQAARSGRQNIAEALAVREVGKNLSDQTDRTDEERYAQYARWLESDDPAARANALLCLIHQTNYLLDRQIAALEAQFVEEGGYSEQLAAARLAARRREVEHPTDPSDRTDRIPPCPQCGKPMVLRTAQKGARAGKQFWGCSGYPDCKGLLEV